MSYAGKANKFGGRESIREQAFASIWSNEINNVFADVAGYYDRVNRVASLGLIDWFRKSFISTIEVKPQQRVLDVCAGTNAVGIALLRKQPSLKVHAVDRSEEMQRVGQKQANAQGFHIDSTITDVHTLPFPDNHFDVVTIQFASRHLRLITVIKEIKRVLKPGGHFYHSDMLRPGNKLVEKAYFAYLTACVSVVAWVFKSNKYALGCKKYFVDALRMFYSPEEMTQLLYDQGFTAVSSKSLLGGVVGSHKAITASQ
ncbi:MAG: bifunctional demethylmenaquinone methyltransferase/2-methoxy-6-polyprenyl-1,4-benzoquinol methylase UbiE [Gammaproteobacteria bacterium]|nr:MAG: bifunctional demethylmenaquinone methyltransferase/2-methoxy-6-polyprenyl-1,4-benzoquinol methylase UbiE [Gammaproteobacteria bacterium]